MGKMLVLSAALGFLSGTASAITIEPLSISSYADTEISTNISYSVILKNITRIAFVVALNATPTNNVEVAIGTDVDGDGNLAVEEAAYTFGYDCGRWHVRDTVANSEVFEIATECQTAGGRIEKTFILKKRKLNAEWNLVKVTRRGFGSVSELVTVDGRRPGFKLEIR